MDADDVKSLTPAQCILLTVHFASEANIRALHSFTPTRHDALDPELVLRILLTYLPEALEPREYLNYIGEVASRLYLDVDREDVEVSTAPVRDLSDADAQKKVKKLRLRNIEAPSYPPDAPKDLVTRFVCHRAYRIDQETGLLNLVPALIEPFLDRNDFIRTWYIGLVLPLLRMTTEYYPDDGNLVISLTDFEKIRGRQGVELLLKKSEQLPAQDRDNISRDIKSLVGPWMYGQTNHKRRKLNWGQNDKNRAQQKRENAVEGATESLRKISLNGIGQHDQSTGHDWEHVFSWLLSHASSDLGYVARAIDGWGGPTDIDLGGIEREGIHYLDENIEKSLELQYAQAAFASCYVAQADSRETITDAHSILARLAELMEFIPPPDLATSVDSLPKIERHAVKLDESQRSSDLLPEALLKHDHPLTTPREETYMLLQMMVYSAYQFSGLSNPLSLISVAKLHFYATAEEQRDILRKILHHLSKPGARKDDSQWNAERAKLIWLWNWGIEADKSDPHHGAGVLGKIAKADFEEEMLKVLTETSCYDMAIELYLAEGSDTVLFADRSEAIILGKAMEIYDTASNGNRQRGAMRRASEIINTFRPYYKNSPKFAQATALIAATHALSFYSLTLQHGVPFQPVSIRVSQEPLSLIAKVLEQNARSYTKLDDLVGIARNLVSAGLKDEDDSEPAQPSSEDMARKRRDAERRVTFMAVEAALREDDFETAYSYVVNRLTPNGADLEAPTSTPKRAHQRQKSSRASKNSFVVDDDDISWRAAFLAGRYRPTTSTPPTLRRLEQRTELLSLALLLAPTPALTEILAAWRRCEEEMTTLQLSQQEAEREFDDRADKRLSSGSAVLPGTFADAEPELVLNQKRREMGRVGGGRVAANDETPLSMFDLTRNFAAKAFSNRNNATTTSVTAGGRSSRDMERSSDSLVSDDGESAQDRVRKRDMVANAVSGGLASGLGWMLGATPAQHNAARDEFGQGR
ncbi:Putative Sec39 domain-containing protein [Septoria linicola]|uniref:Sec39 domain-containing protein n=1 Tax=Septoria linicola TaxID=215465 RepID=A0A9Q9AIU0_9PEZI|nr:Putative Sec39 domain-containing protein [Septoria linicola]